MTSTKIQINDNIQNSMIKTVSVTRLPKLPLVRRAGLIIDFFVFLIFDIWNLFVICLLFFGVLIQNLFDFMNRY